MKKSKNKTDKHLRNHLLQEVFELFDQELCYILNSPEYRLRAHYQIEAIISAIEVYDCGYSGGHNSKSTELIYYNLLDRFVKLVNKEKTKLTPTTNYNSISDLIKTWNDLIIKDNPHIERVTNAILREFDDEYYK